MARLRESLNARGRAPNWWRFWGLGALLVAWRVVGHWRGDPLLRWARLGLAIFVVLIMAVVVWSERQRPAESTPGDSGGGVSIDKWMPLLFLGVVALGAVVVALAASR
jgi:hypothetical protein